MSTTIIALETVAPRKFVITAVLRDITNNGLFFGSNGKKRKKEGGGGKGKEKKKNMSPNTISLDFYVMTCYR